MKNILAALILFVGSINTHAQDTSQPAPIDTSLRITDLNPYFTIHVDSTFEYQLQVNKNVADYFWYLKNAPIGLKIKKDNGLVTFKAEKAFFVSGKLKLDVPYKVLIGVQNLYNPNERVDTSFTLLFYNTEIIPSKVKPTVSGTIWLEEGEPATFRLMCETGSFPIESIITSASMPIGDYTAVTKCGDEFRWTPSYDLVKPSDPEKSKTVLISFIGTNKFQIRDTAIVRFIVKDALNYPVAVEEYLQTIKNLDRYVLQLKFTFLQLDKKLKKNKTARTTFDLTSASTSLTGTILSTSSDAGSQKTGKILPSIGLALVPIKEASVPNRPVDQNQAALIRASIKRLEYMKQENGLVGAKDFDVARKTAKLKDELKQVQVQLIDVPIELTNEVSEEELNQYFNSPKVNKKYRLKTR